MVSHYPAKFGGHWDCGSGDIVFQWSESKISQAYLNLPLLFSLKHIT